MMRGILKLFFDACAGQKRILLWIVAAAALNGGLDASMVLLTREITSAHVFSEPRPVLYLKVAEFMGLIFARGGMGIVLGFLFVSFSQRFMLGYQERIYSHLQRLPWSFYHRRSSGDLVALVTADVGGVTQTVMQLLGICTRELWSIIGIMAAAIWIAPSMAVLVVVVAPILFVSVRWLSRRLRTMSRQVQNMNAEFMARLTERMYSIPLIKICGRSRNEVASFSNFNREMLERIKRLSLFAMFSKPLAETLFGVFLVLALLWGLYRVDSGSLSRDTFIPFLLALFGLYGPLSVLAGLHAAIQKTAGSYERIDLVLNSRVEPPENEGLPWPDGPVDLHFDRLGFRYNDDRWVLREVNLRASCGETLAFVGRSGQGKSTLVRLAIRLLDPSEGRIVAGGVDISHIRLLDLRMKIGFVTQEPLLLRGSIRENIVCAVPSATDDEVVAAARMARIHDFISSLPRGYQTLVGEQGVNLSGGEKQRICLARELLKKPAILILDETTSEVDLSTEREIFTELANRSEGRITLIVSHRLTSLRDIPRIVVFDGGRVCEEGSHEELIAAGGAYANLYALQRRGIDV